jgi:SufS family cysteine desulfurase
MLTPGLDPLLGGQDTDGAMDTSLIARLANELFSGSPWATNSAAPTRPSASDPVPLANQSGNESGVPVPVAADPGASSGKADAPASNSRDIALAGGFPNTPTPSGPPPVHPTVVAPQNNPEEPPPVGTHESGSADTYEFGEPSFYGQNPGARLTRETGGTKIPADYAQSPLAWELHRSSHAVHAPATDLYFLKSLPAASGGWTHVSAPHPSVVPSPGNFNIDAIRRDFPALHQRVNGRPLVWLDNAATTHKPQSVIDATSLFYSRDNSNIHRAAHTLAARSTELFEAGRDKVRDFLGARDSKEIVFVRGTSEAINLVAQSYGRKNIGPGDEIVLTTLEHHANIVPWQLLAEQTGAVIRVAPINDRGELILGEFARLLGPRTKIVSVTHVSNALGTINPIEEIIPLAHSFGVPVLVDGAQSAPHIPINVQALDADFFVFSGHKVFGPTGIGALYGKSHLLEAMPPWQGGGHMIRDVTFEKTIYQNAPEKFEAGTPDIAGVVGLGAAIDYLSQIGLPAIAAYEHALLEYATERLGSVPGLRLIGTAAAKASVLSFVIPGIRNEQIARHLDHRGIAVRAGHHCAQPAQRHFGLESTVRPSLAFYNTNQEVDSLVEALLAIARH